MSRHNRNERPVHKERAEHDVNAYVTEEDNCHPHRFIPIDNSKVITINAGVTWAAARFTIRSIIGLDNRIGPGNEFLIARIEGRIVHIVDNFPNWIKLEDTDMVCGGDCIRYKLITQPGNSVKLLFTFQCEKKRFQHNRGLEPMYLPGNTYWSNILMNVHKVSRFRSTQGRKVIASIFHGIDYKTGRIFGPKDVVPPGTEIIIRIRPGILSRDRKTIQMDPDECKVFHHTVTRAVGDKRHI